MVTLSLIVWILAGIAALLLFLLGGSIPALAALVCLVFYPLIAYALFFRGAKGLMLDMHGSASCVQGTEPDVRLELSRQGGLPVPQVKVTLQVSNLLTGETAKTTVRMAGESSVDMGLASEFCGCLHVQVVHARAMDLFGIVGRRIPCDCSRMVSVFPQPDSGKVHLPSAPSPDSESIVYSPEAKGNDATEVFALREYAPGDSLRNVHWKLSAKTGTLTVKEPSLPVEQKVLLFWDHSSVVGNTPAQADALCHMACALAEELIRSGQGLTLGFDEPGLSQCALIPLSDEGELTMALSQAMRQPQSKAPASGLESLVKAGGAAFSQVFYIGMQEPDDRLLADAHRVIAFVCDGRDDWTADTCHAVIHFGPHSVDQALEVVSALC